jgi:hypothetical protein
MLIPFSSLAQLNPSSEKLCIQINKMKKLKLLMLLSIIDFSVVAQVGSLEVSIKAFIPDPKNAGQANGNIIRLPNGNNGSMVSFATYCFKSDNRGFSSDPKASSRLVTNFTINPTSGTTAAIIPNEGRTIAGITSRINCVDGSVIESKKGVVDRDAIGATAVANGTIQVIGQVTGTNILTPARGLGPSIDYSFDLQWNSTTNTLIAKINFGSFPAFEMYARQPGGKWVPVVQQLPTKTPLSLAGDAFGINTEVKNVTIKIPMVP